MSENEIEWDHDSLEINDQGEITGYIFYAINDGFYISGKVLSYEYKGMNEVKTNYIPYVTICESNGKVKEEIENYNTQNPNHAIDNVRNLMRLIVQTPEDFIDV